MANEQKQLPGKQTPVKQAPVKQTTAKQAPVNNNLFGKENFMWMLAGLAIMVLGFFLMAGGKSPDPTKFNDSDVYSFTRITLAPILIVGGLIVEIFAIMKKSKEV